MFAETLASPSPLDFQHPWRYNGGAMTPKQRKTWRLKNGLTQEDIARALAVSLSMIRFCETGRRNPSTTLGEKWDAYLVACEASRSSKAPK